MTEILQKENPMLRKSAKKVPGGDIATPEIQKVIHTMKKILAAQDDGVALAAPQIGIPLRIFVVSGKVFLEPEDAEKQTDPTKHRPLPPDVVFINPTITKLSRKKRGAGRRMSFCAPLVR